MSSMNLLRRVVALVALVLIAGGASACGTSTEPSSPPDPGNSRFPLLSNGGGHMLSPLRLVTIVAANDPLRDSLFAFTRALPSSQWWKAVATPYGISTTATAVTVTGPKIASGTNFAFNDLTTYVQRAAIDSAGYRPDGHTVYLIYLPPGVHCTTGSSCPTYSASGFHVQFGASDALAVVARQSGSVPAMELTTETASHEIIEAATDPLLNAWRLVGSSLPWNSSPWALDDGGNFEENGDMCVGT